MKTRSIIMKIVGIINIIIVIGSFMFIGGRCADVSFEYDRKYSFLIMLLFAINIYIAMIIHIILHESGHMIAGLATGYDFVSFRVGSIALVKGKDGKMHLKRMKLQGTGGQCLMCPPKLPVEECPYKWYHISGGLMNLGLGIICILLYIFLLPKNYITFALFEEFGVVGISLGLNNLIPLKSGGMQNDGYNLLDLGKNIDAKKCMNIVLEINALITVSDSYSDLPKHLTDEIKSIDFKNMDITNASIANAFNFQAAIYFAEGNYEKAYELQKYMMETPDVLGIFKNEAKCECLFYEITHEQNKDNIEQLYDKKLQQYVKATSVYPSRQRLLYAYYHIYIKDEEKAEEAYLKLKNMTDTYIIKADVLMELEVVENIKNMVVAGKFNKAG